MAKPDLTAKETGDVKDKVDFLYILMIGVIIVLLIGFATGFITIGSWMTSSNAEKQATYQSLRDQVKEQSDKIDALTKALSEQKTVQKAN